MVILIGGFMLLRSGLMTAFLLFIAFPLWAQNLQMEGESLKDSSYVEVTLPEREVLLKIKRTQLRVEQGRTHWQGEVLEDPHGRVHLIENNKTVSGEIVASGQAYILHFDQNQTLLAPAQQITDVGQSQEDDSISLENLRNKGIEPKATVSTTTSDNFVDLMIVYTADVGAISGAEDTIRAMVDSTNTMLEKSCANFRYRLVHLQQVAYTESGNTTTDLTELQDNNGDALDTVHTLRDTYGADLVHLITVNGSSSLCGLAYVSQSGFYNDSYGFGVTRYWCGASTLAHELGHNMGSSHDRYETGNGIQESTAYLTGYGYSDLVNKYRSIMAYSQHCSDLGFSCTAIQTFSNPNIHHNGVPFGVPGYVDAVKRMNEAQPYISNFRDKASTYSLSLPNSCVQSSANKDVHCFIATAAYGSYLHKDVIHFRNFRDQVLKPTAFGRWLVKWYYQVSPYWAHKIQQHSVLKTATQVLLSVVLSVMESWRIYLLGLFTLSAFFLGRPFLWLSLLMISFLATPVKAQVAYPSYFNHLIPINPSLRQVVKQNSTFGIELRKPDLKIENAGAYKETQTGDHQYLVFSSRFSPEATGFFKYNFSGNESSKITQTGFADITQTIKTDQILAQIGTVTAGFVSGLHLEMTTVSRKEDSEDLKTSKYGMGFHGSWGSYFNYGFGANAVLEKGDKVASSNWAELYLGMAAGSFAAESSYYLEIYAIRSPQVLNVKDGLTNAHGETLSTTLALEWDTKVPISFFPQIGLRYELSTEEEKSVDGFIPDKVKKTTNAIYLGTSLFGSPFQLYLGYLSTKIDSSFANEDKTYILSLHLWSGSSGS